MKKNFFDKLIINKAIHLGVLPEKPAGGYSERFWSRLERLMAE